MTKLTSKEAAAKIESIRGDLAAVAAAAAGDSKPTTSTLMQHILTLLKALETALEVIASGF